MISKNNDMIDSATKSVSERLRTKSVSERLRMLFWPAIACVLLVWAYLPVLRMLVFRWETDPRYAHGFMVPFFALTYLWLRRERLAQVSLRPAWSGILLITAAVLLRFLGAYTYIEWLDMVSLLPCIAGFCVLLEGWSFLGWSWPAIAFLLFMFPLPYRVELALGWPLQRIATEASTYGLQTLGLTALSEGNIIVMDNVQINVIEACSGLSMLLLFFALAVGLVMLIRRSWLDTFLIVASAVPIALIANIARITITGVLHELVGEKWANLLFHDLAGWLMTPLALAMLGIELVLLSHLLVERDPAREAPLGIIDVAVPVVASAGKQRAR
jgi:exosortase